MIDINSPQHIFSLVKELSEIPGPSGQEESVRMWLRNNWENRLISLEEDAIGNVIGLVGGSGPRLLLQAHMDEIGFVVRYITPDGFLILDSAQSGRRTLPGHRYMVGQTAQIISGNRVIEEGVFAATSSHLLTREQRDKPYLDYDDFFVDLGLKTREQVEKRGVHIGAGVIWYRPTRQYHTRIVGKALDDRMPLAIMTLLLDILNIKNLQYELWVGATVQEETNSHGALALSHQKAFDMMIALDVGLVGDIPTVKESEYANCLGGGPALVHKDAYVHYDQRLIWQLVNIAKMHGLPIQHTVYGNYGSDAEAFISHGVPSMLVGVPTRYTHTAFEMVELSDIVVTVRLLDAFLTTYASENPSS